MMIVSTPTTLLELRAEARVLLNEFDAADGLASYYVLHHDPARTTLHLHRDPHNVVNGCLVHCRTGFDLFRPLVTLRVRGVNDPVPDLLGSALLPGRPYLMIMPAGLADRVARHVTLTDPVPSLVMRLDPARYRAEINALVITSRDPDKNPRAEIRRADAPVATAGVNWRSPIFAEVYVRVHPEVRGRGWGRAVVRAVVAELLKDGVAPLYTVTEDDDISYDLALDVGFVDTGAREVMAQAVLG
jgi:GNAT superfamily N-acetyltransferase